MLLKRININGFKSFADATELEFVTGITAVVGPNGSGKSNISDGIRWVLGEQSAKSLRGGKMEDVIFAGSDTRRKVNFAEVSLTLDNTDRSLLMEVDEVTVTRRVHRSGESEFLLNKQNCRLKDITELFLDTGIGKEAYSIIGQGRIEEILSSKSEDRRVIFEEAAGISKYKHRKREAERKLEDTEANLLRICDLIAELEGQLEPLQEQATKAEQYKSFREQLKQQELSLYVHQIQEIHRLWKEAGALQAELETRQLALSTVVSTHDAQLEKQRLDLRKLEEEVDGLQTRYTAAAEELERQDGQLHLLQERQMHTAQHIAHAEQDREQLQQRIDARSESLKDEQAKADHVQARLTAAQKSLTEEESRLTGVSQMVSTLSDEQLKVDLLETLNELARVRNEIRYAQQQLEQANRQKQKLQETESAIAQTKMQLLEQKDAHLNAIAVLDRERSERAAQTAQFQTDRETLQGLIRSDQNEAESIRRDIAALHSRKETMSELQNDYEGYAFGVKELLKNRQRHEELRGIHGAVAELIQVPATFEISIEVALGGALQHLVVNDEMAGRSAIGYLKKRQLGRATFLPLDVIQARTVPPADRSKLNEISGFRGIASELVSTNDKYRHIVGNLLGNVLIADSLEIANRIASTTGYRYRIVTLEGDVVHAGGSMTGGSLQKKSANLLGRQRQLEEITQTIADKDRQLQALDRNIAGNSERMQTIDQSLEQLRAESGRAALSAQEAQNQLAQAIQELEHADERSALANADLEELNQSIDASEAQIMSETNRRNELALKEQQLQAAIEQTGVSRKQQETVKEQMQEQLVELKISHAQAKQEHLSIQEQIRRLEQELDGLHHELRLNRDNLDDWNDQQAEHHREISNKQTEVENLRQTKQTTSDELAFKRAARASAQQILDQEESLTRDQRIELRQVDEELHQTEVKCNRYDVELDILLKKLAEDYELSFELAQQRYPVPENVPLTQQTVRDLKRQISALGDVNLGAIEEYARVSERFGFLAGQRDDLVAAKQTLYEVIREINGEMSKRFLATFEQIRGRFSGVFSRLFGGGHADLLLSDPSHVLSTGIDIVAQPPGKSLKNLQLLSGGERALTAIALLFSILHIKPVPFCVLDEVEAALDEANVSRFAQYLREFSQNTQFIVVTHRKGTMEEADVLYGVTMQDSGVSKLVSVRLEEEEAIR